MNGNSGNRRNRYPAIPVVLISLIILCPGCSSLPKDEPKEIVETKTRAAEYAEFGNQYYEQGKFEQALRFFSMALDYNVTVDNEKGIIESYNSIGKVYIALGKSEEALGYYSRAYEAAFKLHDDQLTARSANNIGELYLRQGDHAGAIERFTESIGLFQDGGKATPEQAIVYHNLGAAYKQAGRYEQSLEYLNTALTVNLKNEEYAEIAANYYMIASVYSKMSKYSEAEEFAQKALENDKMVENSYGIGKDLQAIGIIFDNWNKPKEAYEYYKKAFLVFSTIAAESESIKLLEILQKTAAVLGLDNEANTYSEALKAYEQRLTGE